MGISINKLQGRPRVGVPHLIHAGQASAAFEKIEHFGPLRRNSMVFSATPVSVLLATIPMQAILPTGGKW